MRESVIRRTTILSAQLNAVNLSQGFPDDDTFPEMKRLAAFIAYSVEETPAGGRVLVSATNPEALDAVHRFLRFQIEDHRTGDSLEVQPL